MKIELGRKFIRTNPDAEIYDIFVEIGKIQNHIIKSSKTLTKKSTKKYLIEKISKRLLEIEFEENHSIKSKSLSKNIGIVIKHGPNSYWLQKMKRHNISSKRMTYSLSCKKHINNLASRRVTMTNKVFSQKSKCSVCLSDKLKYLQQKT